MEPSDGSRSGWLRPPPKLLIAFGTIAALAATLARGFTFFHEGRPTWTSTDVIVTSLALLAGLTFGWLAFVRERNRPSERTDAWGTLLVASSIAFALTAVVLLVLSPTWMSWLIQEDGLVETGSAVAPFIGAAVLFVAAARPAVQRPVRLTVLASGAFLLLVGLEEVSWFQRVANFSTPDWLDGINSQREFNLHNVETGLTETLYYLGAFALCVFARLRADPTSGSRLLPRPCLAVCMSGAVACALNYDTWQVGYFQVAYFTALAQVVVLALLYRSANRSQAVLLAATAASMLAVQLALLILGHRFERLWDATELREFVISLSFLGYAVQLARTAVASQD